MEIYLRYVGQSAIFGVPARDLSQEEARIHGERRLLASGLYIKKASTPKASHGSERNKALRGGSENKQEGE
jgi:hypothetical protein